MDAFLSNGPIPVIYVFLFLCDRITCGVKSVISACVHLLLLLRYEYGHWLSCQNDIAIAGKSYQQLSTKDNYCSSKLAAYLFSLKTCYAFLLKLMSTKWTRRVSITTTTKLKPSFGAINSQIHDKPYCSYGNIFLVRWLGIHCHQAKQAPKPIASIEYQSLLAPWLI